MPREPRTSVLIPAFNSEATLREAVESALAQTVPDLEVLVIDDGSTVPVERPLAGIHDRRLRVLHHKRNRGTGSARETGVRAARAPLISHLDADDTWAPHYLETVLPRLDDPRVGLVYANATIVGHPHGWTDFIRDLPYMRDPEHHPIDTFPEITNQCPIPTPTVTARTDAVRAVGGYAEWLRLAEDYHLWLKLAAAGWRFAFVDERLANCPWSTAESGQSFDYRRQFRYLLMMWIVFALRHPHLPGPKRQVRVWTKRVARPDWWKT